LPASQISCQSKNMQMPTWAAISTGLAGLAGVVGVLMNLGKILAALGSVFAWCRQRIAGNDRAPGLPAKTIVAIQQPRINALWWSMGKMGERPMMQVVGDFNATNVWTNDVRVLAAIIRYRRWGLLTYTERGDATVQQQHGHYHGHYVIPPNQTTWLRVGFHFVPRHRAPTKRLKADVAIIDQFDNRHWLKGLVFKNINAMLD
jgi:hypothetical protein